MLCGCWKIYSCWENKLQKQASKCSSECWWKAERSLPPFCSLVSEQFSFSMGNCSPSALLVNTFATLTLHYQGFTWFIKQNDLLWWQLFAAGLPCSRHLSVCCLVETIEKEANSSHSYHPSRPSHLVADELCCNWDTTFTFRVLI